MGDPGEIKRYDRSTEAEIDLSPGVVAERMRRLFLLRDLAHFIDKKSASKPAEYQSRQASPLSVDLAVKSHTPDLLSVAQELVDAFMFEEVAVVGAFAGIFFGIERYTTNVDIAVNLNSGAAIGALRVKGIDCYLDLEKTVRLPWLIQARINNIWIKVLPLRVTGAVYLEECGLWITSFRDLIDNKMCAGGMQHVLDIAVLTLLYPQLETFVRAKAIERGLTDKLEMCLRDVRLTNRCPG